MRVLTPDMGGRKLPTMSDPASSTRFLCLLLALCLALAVPLQAQAHGGAAAGAPDGQAHQASAATTQGGDHAECQGGGEQGATCGSGCCGGCQSGLATVDTGAGPGDAQALPGSLAGLTRLPAPVEPYPPRT